MRGYTKETKNFKKKVRILKNTKDCSYYKAPPTTRSEKSKLPFLRGKL